MHRNIPGSCADESKYFIIEGISGLRGDLAKNCTVFRAVSVSPDFSRIFRPFRYIRGRFFVGPVLIKCDVYVAVDVQEGRMACLRWK